MADFLFRYCNKKIKTIPFGNIGTEKARHCNNKSLPAAGTKTSCVVIMDNIPVA